MYTIDKSSNRIAQLEEKRFSDLGFTERNHLQEWLANQPDALGEELLVIQKEFDGFDDTRERLDLLALDKRGNLVVIENKLDDTGRDVVWQALKYASYCSNLTKLQIIEIYQAYLNRYCQGGNAQELICEFLELPDIDEVIINSGNRQRLIFVAAQFRKEVTSTALWLISNSIQLQCFKVTPFQMEDKLLLNVEQIIPTPEAKELMIGISAKEAEEKSAEVELKSRHSLRLAFWEMALEAFRESECDLYENISPSKDHWLSAGSGISACPFNLIFSKKEARVEFSMQRPIAEQNKYIFDELMKNKESIEQEFGAKLEWLRLDSKKASRIQFGNVFDGYNKDQWPIIITWMLKNMSKLEHSLRPFLTKINQELKTSIA